MGCKELVLKKCSNNCLTFEETTRQPGNDNFSCSCSSFARKSKTVRITSKNLISFINEMDELKPNHVKGVHMNDIPIVEDQLKFNILLYDIDFED